MAMAKIWFAKQDVPPEPADLKGEKDLQWCLENLAPLKFWSPLDKLPRIFDEESAIPPEFRNYKFVIVEIDGGDGDLKPGFYLSSLAPKEVWKTLQR
jgi:hypothetical protein